MRAAQNIATTVQNPRRTAGVLLAGSLFVLLLALIILVASGAISAFSAGLQGSLADKAPYDGLFRLLNLLWTTGWILQLMGFGLLTRLLIRTGDESLAMPAFIAIFVAGIIGVLHGSFHMSVETWASLEAARTGFVPEVYEPMRIWISTAFRIAYVLALLGTVGFGYSLLRTRLLALWIGRAAVVWGIFWLVCYVVGAGLPATLFIMPAVIGITLLIDSSEKAV
jgi:hypothetical protein